jgi:hypothetical protein
MFPVARGRGLPGALEAIPVGLKDAAPDVALHFVVADLLIREVREEHIEPAVHFLEITHVSSEFGFDLCAVFASRRSERNGLPVTLKGP